MQAAMQAMFVLYALLGVASALVYRKLPPGSPPTPKRRRRRCAKSKRIVYTLAALFSLDAFGGGFVVQSMLALWLFQKFELRSPSPGTIFFWTGVLLGVLVPGRRAHRQPHRTRQHDGVHASAGEPAVWC